MKNDNSGAIDRYQQYNDLLMELAAARLRNDRILAPMKLMLGLADVSLHMFGRHLLDEADRPGRLRYPDEEVTKSRPLAETREMARKAISMVGRRWEGHPMPSGLEDAIVLLEAAIAEPD